MPRGQEFCQLQQIQKLAQEDQQLPPAEELNRAGTGRKRGKEGVAVRTQLRLARRSRTRLGCRRRPGPRLHPDRERHQTRNLTSAMQALAEKNDAAQDAIDTRSDKYEHPETGLKSVFQQVKAAVASQFGRRSSYAIVAGIRY